MLSAIRKSDKIQILADFASKVNDFFVCPECEKEVVLRKGVVRIRHFAHRSSGVCKHGTGETEAHRKCKLAIYQALLRSSRVRKVALERSLKTVRPDISAYIHGIPVAIEVQLSCLSLETIAHRTAEYAKKGIYVLWLAQWSPYLDGNRYSPRLWEKWVHAAYFGRVYYWTEGLSVIPYRFESHYTRNDCFFGKKKLIKTYKRKSKRYRVPVRGPTLNLLQDFIPQDRDPWEAKVIQIPSAKLYIGRN